MADGEYSQTSTLSADEIQSLQAVRGILLNIIRSLETENVDSNTVDALQFRLDWLHGVIVRLSDTYGMDEQIVQLTGGARDSLATNINVTYGQRTPAAVFTGERGRPKYKIPREHLEFFVERCFSVVNMAALIGASVRTIERRLHEYGLSVRSMFSSMENEDQVIRSILLEFPNTGYRRMTGFLRSRGLRIQKRRIREAMRRVNPAGVLLRALELRTIHRRRYQVPGPLALWHIDGNHKLIRY